jgi:exopolyphosphatase/guanosine-5'-triphosphate,3'-diphosphate pyrophosphatase
MAAFSDIDPPEGGEPAAGGQPAGRALRRTPAREGPPRYAAVDVGTNSIRLLVVQAGRGGRLEPLLRLGESCRLGQGLDAQGSISEEAERRAGHTLLRFVHRARSLEPTAMVVAATHALRSAANGIEVARRLGSIAGVPVQILSAEEEAHLVYRAVREVFDEERLPEPCLVMDIGGGSVELARGEAGALLAWQSLEVGCVRLSERFLLSDPPRREELAFLLEHVERRLDAHPELFGGLAGAAGVGGTLTALAALDLGLERYEAARVEGHRLSREAIRHWSKRLTGLSTAEREGLHAVGEGRADIIVAGCVVLEAVLERSAVSGIIVSTQGLRYALARRLAEIGPPASPISGGGPPRRAPDVPPQPPERT